jgi:tRNA 2-thiouridine synthesizing protein E
MLDINKAINDRDLLQRHDPDGNMYDLEPWSYKIAQNQARQEGLGDLSDTQWRVIHTLRTLYRKNGRADTSRQIMAALEKRVAPEGGRRRLYQLFPDGPVTQGCRLAGVPAPSPAT